MSNVNNRDLLAGWLGYLEEQAASDLVGSKAKLNILQAIDDWSLLQADQFYCLECPLLGDAGVDFSLQYGTDTFLAGANFVGKLGEKYNRFFNLYSQKIGPKQHFYIELDTCSGDSNKLAIFMELPKDKKEAVIHLALGFMGKLGLEQKLEVLRHRAKNLEPVMLGSMLSRLQAPVRICFSPKEHVLNKPERMDDMISFLEGLSNTKNVIEDIREIAQMGFLDCYLDIDILPDGSIGPAIGLELMCCAYSLEQQHMMLDSMQFHRFKEFLQKHALTDERIDCLKRCVFYADLPKATEEEPQEKLFSMISHFKMSYKNGERQPAKVYLQGNRS